MAMAKVLLLEDESWIASAVQDCLEDNGHRVIGPFDSNTKACEAISACSADVALLDINLGNGSNTAATARHLASLGIPFIVLTGYGPDAISGFESASAWLIKPTGEREILAALQNALMPPSA
jgi:DNA-binding response OmpR family regulator